MADPFGFLKYPRKDNAYRPVAERIKDFQEIEVPLAAGERQKQAARCMNCGIPFCHSGNFFGGKRAVSGCPNDNLIPEWNDYLYRGNVKEAFKRLARTNPLPEMTGRVCPAPCEASCTEGLNDTGITICDNEYYIIEEAFKNGWVKESGQPKERTGFKIAVVGSGPAGLAAAWRLNQLGHSVTVFEKADRFGGLLMYGIPNMKLDKTVLERRIDVMKEVGIEFVHSTVIGTDISKAELVYQFDRVLLAIGAGVPRDLAIRGRELGNIELAVDYLTKATKQVLSGAAATNELAGKHVIVIGGGDTGNDCIATAVRLGAESIRQLEILPQPPKARLTDNPWPEYPQIQKRGYGQEEARFLSPANDTLYETTATKFIGKTQVEALEIMKTQNFQPVAGTEEVIPADLILLAMGFTGAEQAIFDDFQITETYDNYQTNNNFVYVAGDARRGPSLVIWAIREGRKAAEAIHQALMVHQEN